MKLIFVLISLFLNNAIFGQKLISYKYEKEKQGKSLWGGKIVGSESTESRRTLSTVFIFDFKKNILKIGNKLLEIFKLDAFNFSSTTCDINILGTGIDGKDNGQILIKYNNGNIFRYYLKQSQWKL